MPGSLHYSLERRRFAEPFRISGYVFEATDLLVVTLSDGEHRGRGEAAGVYYLGDNAEKMIAVLEQHRDAIEGCETREQLRSRLPAGGARNAVDCALWDLEAKLSGVPTWQVINALAPQKLVTAYTLSLGEPEAMRQQAAEHAGRALLKVKVGTADDAARIRAVRAGAPDSAIILDANEGWTPENLAHHFAVCAEARIALVEQPLDDALPGLAPARLILSDQLDDLLRCVRVDAPAESTQDLVGPPPHLGVLAPRRLAEGLLGKLPRLPELPLSPFPRGKVTRAELAYPVGDFLLAGRQDRRGGGGERQVSEQDERDRKKPVPGE